MSDKSIAGFLSYAASGTVNSVEQYPNIGCDLCAGVPLAPDSQSCDHRCSCGRQLACERHGGVYREALRLMAVANASAALRAIHGGDSGEAAQLAKNAVTVCRMHQLAGGNPWDGGE